MAIKSVLNIEETTIENLVFESDETSNYFIDNEMIEIAILPRFILNKDDKTRVKVSITLTIFNENFREENKPFYIEVKSSTFFVYSGEEISGEELINKFAANMISMAYPYVRSYISAFSSLSGIKTVTIPPINVLNLLDSLSDESNSE